jgi:hypothetical protein
MKLSPRVGVGQGAVMDWARILALSLLKSRFGRGIGLPMKTLADEF